MVESHNLVEVLYTGKLVGQTTALTTAAGLEAETADHYFPLPSIQDFPYSQLVLQLIQVPLLDGLSQNYTPEICTCC